MCLSRTKGALRGDGVCSGRYLRGIDGVQGPRADAS